MAAGLVVTGGVVEVVLDGEVLTLVEDTVESDGGPAAAGWSVRVWLTADGREVRTRSAVSGPDLAEAVRSEAAGQALVRAMASGVPQEELTAAVARAAALDVVEDGAVVEVDGQAAGGLRLAVDGWGVSGVETVDALVLVAREGSGRVGLRLA